jgi:hypothetical protein
LCGLVKKKRKKEKKRERERWRERKEKKKGGGKKNLTRCYNKLSNIKFYCNKL